MPTPERLADEIDRQIRALPVPGVAPARSVRRDYTRRLRTADAATVLAAAEALLGRQRWVAYELIRHHQGAMAALDAERVERLGAGLAGWGDVDAFACILAGHAWRAGRIGDDTVREWACSEDRWWRRTALVCTTRLDDTERTVDICALLASDRDPMVVKALSWALRELSTKDAAATESFLERHDVAALVRREVRNKLATGLKNPRPAARRSARPDA